MDLNKKTFTTEVAGRPFSIEVSKLAGQANASVLAKYGETIILATAVMGQKDRPGDFFPLMVNYEEKFYAAGKILGSRFMRREGKSSDDAVLSGRLIDRTVRPLFDDRLRREVQVVTTTLSIDTTNDPVFVALIAASTALAISDIPWNGPVAGVSVAKVDGQLVINPALDKMVDTKPEFDAFFAGVEGKVNMIEVAGNETDEDSVIAGIESALTEIKKLVAFQNSIVKEIGKPKTEVAISTPDPALISAVNDFLKDKLEPALYIANRSERDTKLGELKDSLIETVADANADLIPQIETLLETAIDDMMHVNIIKSDRRVDGRALDQIRELHTEVHLFERPHGTGLFMRGATQSLATVTLAAPSQEKLVEGMDSIDKKRFFLHYNFPPYSVGEIGPFRGPGRREIGHGALAEKALAPLIPTTEEFPYTIRIVSEILSSNGSSSMASVCAGCLALMDAGVPIKKPVAGIAMGVITNKEGDYKVLTDIQGPEDHYGDMDFKVAGTKDGITAIQMDVKIDGITPSILKEGLAQAKKARLTIIDKINEAISVPRETVSSFAPAITVVKIDPAKIGELIGPGGKIINGIIDRTGADINIDDDGSVFVSATSKESLDRALAEVKSITKVFSVGEIVEGTIIRTMEFGAIVDLGGGKDGMIHISELKEGFVKKAEDVVKEGDFVKAKIIKVENGKIGLSIKQLADKK